MLRRGLLIIAMVGAGCTASGPADDAQLAVSRTIDCTRLAPPVAREAARTPSEEAAPIGTPLQVRLQELGKISPAVAPGRKEKGQDRFAGFLPLRADASGTYTVLLASLAWADLGTLKPPRLVEPKSFKWIEVCGTNYKSGLYDLQAGVPYFVQLWDSPDREVMMMIRRLP